MLKTSQIYSLLLLGLSILPASAVTVEINYDYDTNGFFSETTKNGVAARATMEAAAAFYGQILTDSLSPIQSNVETNDNYEITFNHPSDFNTVTIPFLQIPADTIRIYVGSRSNLGSELARAGTGTPSKEFPSASISGNREFVFTAAYRGQDFGTESEPNPEIAPWGGYITFNSNPYGRQNFWNYDYNNAPGFNYDLYSTALHEIGHILGVGTSESFSSLIAEGPVFKGSRTIYFNGGNPIELTGDRDHVNEQRLETKLHPYAEGTVKQLSLYLSTRPIRTRREVTLLDAAILDDIGWNVNYLTLLQ